MIINLYHAYFENKFHPILRTDYSKKKHPVIFRRLSGRGERQDAHLHCSIKKCPLKNKLRNNNIFLRSTYVVNI
jgi:hypothetical protein